jgi:hypothetical protein
MRRRVHCDSVRGCLPRPGAVRPLGLALGRWRAGLGRRGLWLADTVHLCRQRDPFARVQEHTVAEQPRRGHRDSRQIACA